MVADNPNLKIPEMKTDWEALGDSMKEKPEKFTVPPGNQNAFEYLVRGLISISDQLDYLITVLERNDDPPEMKELLRQTVILNNELATRQLQHLKAHTEDSEPKGHGWKDQ